MLAIIDSLRAGAYDAPLSPHRARRAMQDRSQYTFSRRNYVLGIVNGAFFHVGMAIIGMQAAGALFVRHLVPGNWPIALISSLMLFGWVWPQLIISNMVEHRRYKKPFYVFSAVFRTILFGCIVLSVWLIGDSHPKVTYALFALLLFGFTTMGGVGIIPFMDIVSKSVPPNRRGSFFSLRQFYGGAAAFGAGIMVKKVLADGSGIAFPANYLLIFGIAFVLFAISTTSFCFCDEPAGAISGYSMSLKQRVRRGWRIFRRDRNYQRLYLVRAGMALGAMGWPLYTVYAIRDLGFAEKQIGLFMQVGAVAAVVSNFVWRHIGDRYGNRLLLLCAASLAVAGPLAAFVAGHLPAVQIGWLGMDLRLAVYLLVYASAAPALAGTGTAQTNYLLEIAPETRRPTYVGFMYTIGAPLAFAGVVGGVIADVTSPQVVFAVSVVCSVGVVYQIRRMDEPRRSRQLASRYAKWRTALGKDVADRGLRMDHAR